MKALDQRLETAVDIATGARALAMRMRSTSGVAGATLKGAHDWLTEADTAVEPLISAQLATAHPEDGFHGEEAGLIRAGTLRWVMDPIEGNVHYMRGRARFCQSPRVLPWFQFSLRGFA